MAYQDFVDYCTSVWNREGRGPKRYIITDDERVQVTKDVLALKTSTDRGDPIPGGRIEFLVNPKTHELVQLTVLAEVPR